MRTPSSPSFCCRVPVAFGFWALAIVFDGIHTLAGSFLSFDVFAIFRSTHHAHRFRRINRSCCRSLLAIQPLDPRDKTPAYQVQPQTQQDARAGGRVGRGVAGTGGIARIPAFAATAQAGSSPPVAGKVPLPPAAAFSEPGRAPT